MKVRVVRNRRGIHVHGFYCTDYGRGEEEIVEASSAIDLVDEIEEDVANVLFYPCASFGSPSDVTPPDIPARASQNVKMATLGEWAEENGWDVEDDGSSTLHLSRDSGPEETIRLIFEGPRYNAKASGYECDGVPEYLPDLSVVVLRISGEPGVPISTARRRAEDLPWADDAEDDEIIDFLVDHGARIYWINSISGGEETAVVAPMLLDEKGKEFNSRQTCIQTNGRGDRILTFCDGAAGGQTGGGFRSVRLDQILKVV